MSSLKRAATTCIIMFVSTHSLNSRDLIAEVIRFGHFSESDLHPENLYELRELCRGRHAVVSMQSDVKRKVIALLD